MTTMNIAVRATTGSPFGPGGNPKPSYPVGAGFVDGTLTDRGEPADALVLMVEPALPGRSVRARPVALLHVLMDGRPTDEAVCVAAADASFEAIGDLSGLRAWHADAETLTALMGRLDHAHRWQLVGCEGPTAAEAVLSRARHSYERLTGCME